MTIILGLATIIVALLSYGFYIRDILRGRTKPHGFTWATWALLAVFIFFQQNAANAGPGSWSTAFVAIAATLICALSVRYGERNITVLDWLSLSGVCLVFLLWLCNFDSRLSALLASLAFVIGFIPTIRKSIRKADQETIITYALNSLKFLMALFALHAFTVETAAYPFVLFVANACFALFLLIRTSSLSRPNKKRSAHV